MSVFGRKKAVKPTISLDSSSSSSSSALSSSTSSRAPSSTLAKTSLRTGRRPVTKKTFEIATIEPGDSVIERVKAPVAGWDYFNFNFTEFSWNMLEQFSVLDDAIVATLEYQTIDAKRVLVKALLVWLCCDDTAKASIFVCCMAGNKHGRLLKAKKVEGALFLPAQFVDGSGPTDLTLGRFLVSLGCIFRRNVDDYYSKNCGHAAYDDASFELFYYNFLSVQCEWWQVYNPGQELTTKVIADAAKIMNLQRASAIVNLVELVPTQKLIPLTLREFCDSYGCEEEDVPAHAPAEKCTSADSLLKTMQKLSLTELNKLSKRALTVREASTKGRRAEVEPGGDEFEYDSD